MISFAETKPDSFELFASLIRSGFAPRPIVPSWEWVCANGRTPESQPFDANLMPWAKGVCEAWDDPRVREIVLMWGTRLGKTMISMQLVAKTMATNPLPGLIATATEALATRTTREKLYKVLAAIRETSNQLLPERFRSNREIRLTESTWPVIWSGSNTMLADWGACCGWANEVSKWDEKKSMTGVAKAGDTLSQFLERFKEYWHTRKVLFECSPGLKGYCKISRKFNESNQCQFHVPCPRCKQFQVLKLGNGDGTGGIVFDRTPAGRLDPDLAARTAKYQCAKCHKAIADEERPRMMRRGVWAPKGCTVDRKGKLCGTAERTCDVWGGQLSSLYSLQLQWGDIAKKFVECRSNPAQLQVFVNDWLSETWEPFYVKSEPEDVAEAPPTEEPVGIMPKATTWLFASVDVQAEYFKWMKVAAGTDERVVIVDRGICDTWAEVKSIIDTPTPHADGGTSLLPCLTLIDSGDGNKTDEVYQKCREWSRPERLVVPCKGDNTDSGASYVKKTVTPEQHKSKTLKRKTIRAQGAVLFRVNSFWHEPIIDRWLNDRKPGEFDSLGVPSELAADVDFMRELCNGVQSADPSKMNPNRLLWCKRWASEANDFRDCLKYCRCAIDIKFRGNWRVAETRQPANIDPPAAPVTKPVKRATRTMKAERRVATGARRLQLGGRRVSR